MLFPAGGHDLTNNEVTPGKKKAALLCDPRCSGGGLRPLPLWPRGRLGFEAWVGAAAVTRRGSGPPRGTGENRIRSLTSPSVMPPGERVSVLVKVTFKWERQTPPQINDRRYKQM